MKKIIPFLFLLLFTFCVFAGTQDNLQNYAWKPLKIGGGGWVTGMYIHPAERGLIYVRTDVSGAYRWESATSSWKQIVTSSSMPSDYVAYSTYNGVQSLAGAPGDPNIAYMAFQNKVFKSSDRGDTWTVTSFSGGSTSPNGAGRQEGERLVVDPNNNDVVYYGTINDGLWLTENGGGNWSKVTTIPHGITNHGVNTIVFDKNSGTTNSKTNTIYVTVDGEGVYKSTNAGQSWTKISDVSNPRPRDAEIGTDGTYYVVYTNEDGAAGTVWKYSSSGNWTNITPSGNQPYWDIAVDPTNNQRIVVIKNGGGAWTSVNQGATWTSQGSFKLESTDIEWLGKQTTWWLSVGEILFDPFDSGKLWFAEGFGVWWTKDLADAQITWIEASKGIEETCGNTVICPPGGKPLTAMWDIGVFYHSAPDTYNAQRAYSSFISAWHLDWCPADPDFIAATIQNHQSYNPEQKSGYSTDGGKTWQLFSSLPPASDLTYGCIAVSATDKNNIVWMPSNGRLPSYSKNRGASWQQAVFPEITSSGVTSHTSPRKPLCADRVDASTFYFYHNNGIFRSTNGGADWTKVSTSFSDRWNIMMKTTPGHAKDIWLAEGKQGNVVGGLWHSVDGGITWSVVPGLQQAFSFGFGKAETEGGYPTVFAAGVANGQHGIYRSTDAGNTWERIGIYPLGIYDYVDDIDGDKDVFGKVYICFAGAGFAYGEEISSTSLKKTKETDMVVAYQNGNFTINHIRQKTFVRIYDIAGMLIYESEYEHDFSVNLSDVPSGILIANIYDGNVQLSKKIVHR